MHHRAVPFDFVTRRCVFCGGGPVTREHVFPRWLRTPYGRADRVVTITETPSGRKTGKPQVPFDATVRSVCGDCNNGWMSALETRAKPLVLPMLAGGRQHLDRAAMETMAAWVFKTAIMIHEQVPGPDRPVPPGHFGKLYATGLPPVGVQIWLGRHTNPLTGPMTMAMASGDRLVVSHSLDPEVPVGTRLYGFSLAVGAVTGHVLGNIDGEGRPQIATASSDLLVPIWPGSGSLWWPPPRSGDEVGGAAGLHRLLFGDTPVG